jgi:hypothetical protein
MTSHLDRPAGLAAPVTLIAPAAAAAPEAPYVGPLPLGPADHVRMGVGARFSLHPAADDVVPVILGALEAGRAAVPEVAVRTDDVSTLVRGSEQHIASYLTAVMLRAARSTPSGHVTATVALSRGCPGEVRCDPTPGGLPAVPPVVLGPTTLRAAAHWALYPLGVPDAMGPIERAIRRAQDAGTWGGAESFATRLDGDLADVVATLVDTWAAVGQDVAHVVAHATVSVGSPSVRGAR